MVQFPSSVVLDVIPSDRESQAILPMSLNFPRHLKKKAEIYGDNSCLEDFDKGRKYTYREMDELTDRLAGGLRDLGVQSGERVVLIHPNHSDFILACLAVIKAGAVAVPVNPLYKAPEVTHILENSGAVFLLIAEACADILPQIRRTPACLRNILIKKSGEGLENLLVREGARLQAFSDDARRADDPAFIFYTSGTTGRPKGVILSHRNITFGGANTAQSYCLKETDAALLCLPLVHIFANASPVLGTLNSGGRIVVMERFQTDHVFEAIVRHRITWLSAVPTMFGYLLNGVEEQPRNLGDLRFGLSGGASLPVKYLRDFEDKYQVPIIEAYGLTESTGLVTVNPVFGEHKPGSIGLSAAGVSVRLLDGKGRDVSRGEVGELVFRGPNATPGYWNLPEATAAAIRDGWFHTGDLARQTDDGYFYLAGRRDELIICGGYNIYPREIEEVLYRQGDLAEVAVIGMPDANLGHVPKAFVSFKSGRSRNPEDILDFCRSHLADYKIPRTLEVLRELPKNSTGKILKNVLADEMSDIPCRFLARSENCPAGN